MNLSKELTMQDVLAIIVSLGVFGLVYMKLPVPDQLWSGWVMVITFFFTQDKKPSNEIPPKAP